MRISPPTGRSSGWMDIEGAGKLDLATLEAHGVPLTTPKTEE
jgi:hypothetical protein